MPQLPLEVWLHITSFMDSREIRLLNGVSKMLTDIFLNHHYRRLQIIPNDVSTPTAARLSRLSDTQLSLVRELVFHIRVGPTTIASTSKSVPRLENGLPSRWPSILSRFSVRNKSLIPQIVLNKVVGQLRNVSSLNITLNLFDRPSDEQAERRRSSLALPLVRSGWSTYAHGLRSLQLSLPLELLLGFLPSSSPGLKFPSLEDLNISIISTPNRGSSPVLLEVSTAIALFVNDNNRSLQSLRFNSSAAFLDLAVLFRQLHHIPHLRSFAVGADHVSCGRCVGMDYRFLQMFSDTLTTLILTVPLSATGYRGLDFHPKVLQRLTIVLQPEHIQPRIVPIGSDLLRFLETYSANLLTFSVNMLLTFPITLSGVLSCFPPSSKLTSFTVRVKCITPALLDLLSTNLPINVKDVTLMIFYFSSIFHEHACRSDEFCREMSNRRYADWKLDNLWLMPLGGRIIEGGHRDGCITAIVEAMPHLLMINGVSRKDYLQIRRA